MTTVHMSSSKYDRGWQETTDAGGGRRPDPRPLLAVLSSLYEQPHSGRVWTYELLANNSRLDIDDVKAAFKIVSKLVPWQVYDKLLYELEADEDDVAVCRQTYRHLAQHFEQRHAPPPDITALTTQARFMAALKSLQQKAGLSLREISDKMREESPKHTLGRSALQRYLPDNGTEPTWPTNRQRLHTLVTVLCNQAKRPSDTEHFMAVWERLGSDRIRSFRPSIAMPPAQYPAWGWEVNTTASTRPLRLAGLILPAVVLLAVVVLVIVMAA